MGEKRVEVLCTKSTTEGENYSTFLKETLKFTYSRVAQCLAPRAKASGPQDSLWSGNLAVWEHCPTPPNPPPQARLGQSWTTLPPPPLLGLGQTTVPPFPLPQRGPGHAPMYLCPGLGPGHTLVPSLHPTPAYAEPGPGHAPVLFPPHSSPQGQVRDRLCPLHPSGPGWG